MMGRYLKEHKGGVLACLIFLLTAGFVSYVYSLPLEPVLYILGAFMLLGTLLFLWGFWRERKKHGLLQKEGSVGEPFRLIEADYEALLQAEREKAEAVRTTLDEKSRDMLDYYTLLAHQMKTPLFAMELLLSEEDKELWAELFKVERYVEMMLGYVRIENISGDLIAGEKQVFGIVKEAVKKYAPLFIRKNIRLTLREEPFPVVTDEKWLSFVMEQVLSNAVKYVKEGGRVEIYKEGDSLVISDDGIGIRSADLPRLFTKGYTGRTGRDYKSSTGLGLYLSGRVMEKLGHGIRISSEEGRGTKVHLQFKNLTKL